MPMRVGDIPEGGSPEGPAPGAAGVPPTEDPEAAAKQKKGGGDGVVGDAVEAAGWGCAIFEVPGLRVDAGARGGDHGRGAAPVPP